MGKLQTPKRIRISFKNIATLQVTYGPCKPSLLVPCVRRKTAFPHPQNVANNVFVGFTQQRLWKRSLISPLQRKDGPEKFLDGDRVSVSHNHWVVSNNYDLTRRDGPHVNVRRRADDRRSIEGSTNVARIEISQYPD